MAGPRDRDDEENEPRNPIGGRDLARGGLRHGRAADIHGPPRFHPTPARSVTPPRSRRGPSSVVGDLAPSRIPDARIDEETSAGERRYRSLVEATAAIVWNTPASGEFEADQPGWSDFTGQSFEQLRGWGWLDAVHPEDRPDTALVWSRAVVGPDPCTRWNTGCVAATASIATCPSAPSRSLADDGSLREWVGVHTDITERVRTEGPCARAANASWPPWPPPARGRSAGTCAPGPSEWDEPLNRLFGLRTRPDRAPRSTSSWP